MNTTKNEEFGDCRFYIAVKRSNVPNSNIWDEILTAFEGEGCEGKERYGVALHTKKAAWIISNRLQFEALEKLKAINPEASRFPKFVPCELPF